MEDSTDSSITTNVTKQNKLKNSIFKHSSVTKKNAFTISLNESDSPTLGSIDTPLVKKNPFTMAKKINNEDLSVSACHSINESESEKTDFHLKSKNLFGKKVESPNNQFNVFFENSSIVQNTQNTSHNAENETVEEVNSTIEETRCNPFQANEKPQKHLFNIEFDETGNNEQSLPEISPEKLQIFQKQSLHSKLFNVLYDDSLTHCSQPLDTSKKSSTEEITNGDHNKKKKKSLYDKNAEELNVDTFNTDFNDSKLSDDSGKINNATDSNKMFDVSFTITNSNKQNFEQPNRTLNSMSGVPRTAIEVQDYGGISVFDSENDLDNLSNYGKISVDKNTSISSLNKNLSKNVDATINSEICNTQSSYNDENLNNWMTAESNIEVSPPQVSPIQSNIIADENIPETAKTVTAEKITSSSFWENKFNDILSNASQKKNHIEFSDAVQVFRSPQKNTDKPATTNKKISQPRIQALTKLKKPAPYANKRLYHYIINKIKPRFGIDSYIKAEELVLSICETVKIVNRKKDHQKKLIEKLKKEMAGLGIIETTVDFNEFVIKFLPYSFRIKVIPCLQPLTNTIYPPRDTLNPFDKII